MSSDLNRRQLLLAGGAAWLGVGAMGQCLWPSPRESPRRSSSSPRARAFSTRSSPARATSRPRRASLDGHRQGARLRGRRIQGWPIVRARPDRPVGRLRLRDDRRPDHEPGTRQEPADFARRRKGVLRRHPRRQGLHGDALRHRHLRPLRQARTKGAEDPYIQMIGGEFIVARAAASRSHRDRRSRVPRARQAASAHRATRSRSRTNGTPSRTCPTTCTSSWFRSPKG